MQTAFRPSVAGLRAPLPGRGAPRRSALRVRAETQFETESTKGIMAGDISRENAEERANEGIPEKQAPDFTQAQAFDGPAPETINSRLAMLGVVAALGAELRTGVGIREQVASAPVSILATFLLISFASYIPIFRGYTRKEPYSSTVWNPKSENWNGRVAMLGFTALIITEALAGISTVDYWGLPHGSAPLPGF